MGQFIPAFAFQPFYEQRESAFQRFSRFGFKERSVNHGHMLGMFKAYPFQRPNPNIAPVLLNGRVDDEIIQTVAQIIDIEMPFAAWISAIGPCQRRSDSILKIHIGPGGQNRNKALPARRIFMSPGFAQTFPSRFRAPGFLHGGYEMAVQAAQVQRIVNWISHNFFPVRGKV